MTTIFLTRLRRACGASGHARTSSVGLDLQTDSLRRREAFALEKSEEIEVVPLHLRPHDADADRRGIGAELLHQRVADAAAAELGMDADRVDRGGRLGEA